MMGEIREKPQEKKIETMADEMADAKKEITVKGIYNADVGPGMSVAYALLCLPFWVNAMGWGNTAGFALSMGMIQIGYFIMYMVCGMYFLKLGNQVSGGIYVVFAAAFGLFGGIGNISSAVCPVLGIQYDPMLVSVCFTAAGLYLLAILPCVSYASKLDFLNLLGAGAGVTAFGLAGFGILPAVFSKVGGWGILVSGLTSYYLGIAGHLKNAGIELSGGEPFFKK
ncbi:MAG: hypothetical protein HFG22_18435 [Lachnospiraceae bacterium]|nr:hypothetical protein [Lachnospiraceae bacterium]